MIEYKAVKPVPCFVSTKKTRQKCIGCDRIIEEHRGEITERKQSSVGSVLFSFFTHGGRGRATFQQVLCIGCCLNPTYFSFAVLLSGVVHFLLFIFQHGSVGCLLSSNVSLKILSLFFFPSFFFFFFFSLSFFVYYSFCISFVPFGYLPINVNEHCFLCTTSSFCS